MRHIRIFRSPVLDSNCLFPRKTVLDGWYSYECALILGSLWKRISISFC